MPKSKAEALIAAAKGRGAMPMPAPEAIAQLKKLIAHNDATTVQRQKVGCEDAVALLREFGWQGSSRTALDRLCRDALGRRSYGTP